MDGLNYHHLHYFWVTVREGGLAAAARALGVGRPAVSMQVQALESSLGAALFERRGPRLELTETGRLVHEYAEEIFRTGRELLDAVRGRPVDQPQRLRVGISDAMVKLVAFRLLEPLLGDGEPFVLQCHEAVPERLFAALSVHELDLVLSDVALPPGSGVRAYNHVMGRSAVTLFAAPELAAELRADFPGRLDGSPLLLPSEGSAQRRPLERWFEERDLRPRVVAEIADSALTKVLGQAGHGAFVAPQVVAEEVVRQYGVESVGVLEGLSETFYAVSPERRIEHRGVARLVEHAARDLFERA